MTDPSDTRLEHAVSYPAGQRPGEKYTEVPGSQLEGKHAEVLVSGPRWSKKKPSYWVSLTLWMSFVQKSDGLKVVVSVGGDVTLASVRKLEAIVAIESEPSTNQKEQIKRRPGLSIIEHSWGIIRKGEKLAGGRDQGVFR